LVVIVFRYSLAASWPPPSASWSMAMTPALIGFAIAAPDR
jgi:hypothetical protein